MSKSLGNVILTHQLLREWPGEVIRWALLSAHYRQPLEWTGQLLEQSKRQLDRFYRVLLDYEPTQDAPIAPSVLGALNDDLNTPEAFAALHELRDGVMDEQTAGVLLSSGQMLGFFNVTPGKWFQGDVDDGPDATEIEAKIAARAEAKKQKDFARADEIRDELQAQGIIIEDGAGGATWRRA